MKEQAPHILKSCHHWYSGYSQLDTLGLTLSLAFSGEGCDLTRSSPVFMKQDPPYTLLRQCWL